jgi:hypothetical protein
VQNTQKYTSEKALVNKAMRLLRSGDGPWCKLQLGREFNYLRGRPDIIALAKKKELIAFEAKLKRWRNALNQAYRNTCFAHRSFVILPQETAELASKHRHEFERRAIGLCSVSADRIEILIPAPFNNPLQPQLSIKATVSLTGVKK